MSTYQLFGPELASGISGLVPSALAGFQPAEMAIMNLAAEAAFYDAGFAAVVDLSMATDHQAIATPSSSPCSSAWQRHWSR